MHMHPLLKRLPAPLIALAIFILSAQSTLPMPPTPFLSPDKVAHCISFGTLAFALSLWFPLSRWNERPLQTALLVVLLTSLYGASDEFHQYFVPGRDTSFGDWVADTVGAVAAVLIVLRETTRAGKRGVKGA